MPSQITVQTIKAYRRRIHDENATIRAAAEAGRPLISRRTRSPLRPLGNDSINRTLRTLAAVLDDAEDQGWIDRNVARGRRMREPVQRRKGDILQPDEFLSLIEAADVLDNQRHSWRTLERAREVRRLRDEKRLMWQQVTAQAGVSMGTAFYLYGCRESGAGAGGPRRAIIATLGLAGLRVGELCELDEPHIDLARGQIHVRESKTGAGIRVVDIQPRLRQELEAYREARRPLGDESPAFPTRTGRRRDRQNVGGVVQTVLRQANALRSKRGEPPILARVTPHTLRRSYISFMLAAGHDVPYVQAQVGHEDPTTTLKIYARVISQPDRNRLRRQMAELLQGAIDGEAEHLDDDQERLF